MTGRRRVLCGNWWSTLRYETKPFVPHETAAPPVRIHCRTSASLVTHKNKPSTSPRKSPKQRHPRQRSRIVARVLYHADLHRLSALPHRARQRLHREYYLRPVSRLLRCLIPVRTPRLFSSPQHSLGLCPAPSPTARSSLGEGL